MRIRTQEDAKKFMEVPKEELVRDLMVAYDILDAYDGVLMNEIGSKAFNDLILKVSRLVTKEAMLQAYPDADEKDIDETLDKTDEYFRAKEREGRK